jgi:hypothetical protein
VWRPGGVGARQGGLLREKADNKAILDGFGWLQEHMGPKDLAFIFLSTHAYGDRTGFGLLPAGYRSGPGWRERIVSGQHLRAGLSKLPGPVVLCLDCCQAAYLLNKQHNWKNVVVICGCGANEESYLGGLSVGVIAALSGQADRNKDGQVSIAEFQRFVVQWVKRNYKGYRHPAKTSNKNVDRVVLVGPRN